MKNGLHLTMFNANVGKLTRLTLRNRPKKLRSFGETSYCAGGGYSSRVLTKQETLNAHLCVQQLQRVYRSLVEKRLGLVSTENIVLHDNVWTHSARTTQEKENGTHLFCSI